MSSWTMRRLVGYGLAALVALGVLAGAAAGGFFWYSQQRQQGFLKKGDEFFARGEWLFAKRQYQLWLTKHRDDVDTLLKYTEACLNLTDDRANALRDAAKGLHQILQVDPANKEIQRRLCDLYIRTRDFTGLHEFVQYSWLRVAPDDPDALFYKALALDELGKDHDARPIYEELIKRGKAPAEAYGRLARLLLGLNYTQDAHEVMRSALASYADDGEVHYQNYLFLEAAGDADGARAALDEALRLKPDDVEALLARARELTAEQNWDGVVAFADKAIALKPDEGVAYLMKARALQRKGDMEGSKALIEGMDPAVRADVPAITLALIEMQMAGNEWDKAAASIDSYLASYPTHRPIRDYLEGRALLHQGDYQGAIQRFAVVRQQMPAFPPVTYYLGRAYLMAGQRDLARVTLESYLRTNPGDQGARALMAQEFGTQLRQADIDELARTALSNPNLSAPELAPVAAALLRSAQNQGRLDELKGRILEILERIRSLEPRNPVSYQIEADMWLAAGAPEAAQAALQRGIAADVEEQAFLTARAALDLAADDLEAAWGRFEMAAAGGDGAQVYIDWAVFFAARGRHELAERVFEEGLAALSGEEWLRLECDRAVYAARQGLVEKALAILEDAAGRGARENLDKAPLVAAKINVARAGASQAAGGSLRRLEALVDEALEAEPENLTGLALKGELILREPAPDVEAAAALFERALAVDEGDVAALMGMANVEMRRGAPGMALEYASRAASRAPESPAPQLLAAELSMRLKLYPDAEQALRKAMDLQPGDPRAVRMLFGVYVAQEEFGKARALVAEAGPRLARTPEGKEVAAELEGALLALGSDSQEALAQLRARYEAAPDSLGAARDYALALRRAGSIADAEAALEAYTGKHPEDADGWVALARLRMGTADDEALGRALTALIQALLCEPQHLGALRDLIVLQLRRENMGEALAYCERYLSVRPGDADVLYQRAALLAQQGQYEAALDSIERATGVQETDEYLRLRGLLRLQVGRPGEALDDLRRYAQSAQDTSAQIDAAIAEAYLGAGDKDEARRYFVAAKDKAAKGEAVEPRRMRRLEVALAVEGGGA